MRVSSQTLSQSWLAATRRSQADLLDIQLKVATGKNILSAADDPEGAMRILSLNRAMDKVAIHQDHAEAARRRLSLEEQALSQVSGVLDRLRELSIRASSPALNDAGRASLATEARALQDQMLQLANSQDGRGEYLFAGNRVSTEPFVATGGQVSYQGDQGTRRLEIGDGRFLADGEPGDRVFMAIPGGNGRFAVDADPVNTGTGVIASSSITDPAAWSGQSFTVRFTAPGAWEARDAGGSVVASGTHASGDTLAFGGIEFRLDGSPAAGDAFDIAPAMPVSVFDIGARLITALETPAPDPVASARTRNELNAVQEGLDQALGAVSSTRGRVGTRLSAVDNQREINEGLVLELESTLSTVQDLDYAQALSRLETQMFSLEAAQKAYMQTRQLSLFRYL